VYSISDLEQKIEAVTKLEAEVLTPSNGADSDSLEHHKLGSLEDRKKKTA
jgi:hypothetical protein